jgi:WD40 repeat protein
MMVKRRINKPGESGLMIWHTQDMQPASEGLTYPDWNSTAMSFSQDENIIAVGYQTIENRAAILIVDTQTGEILEGPLPMDEQDRRITHLAFHPDGSILVIGNNRLLSDGSTGKRIRKWDRNAGDWHHFGVAKEKEYKLQYSPDGEHLAVMYNTFVSGGLPTINLVPANAGSVFTPDSQHLVSGGPNGTLYVWSLEGRAGVLQRQLQNNQNCTQTAFSPDGRFLVGECFHRGMILWEVSTGEEIACNEIIVDQKNSAQSIAFSPDGERIATGYDWGLVALWDASTLELIGELNHENTMTVTSLAFSPDSRWLAAGSAPKFPNNDPTLVLFRAEDGTKVMSFSSDTLYLVKNMAWSPLSDRLIVGGHSNTLLDTDPVDVEPGALESGAITLGGTPHPFTFWTIDSLSIALEAQDPDLAEIRIVLQDVFTGKLSLSPDGKYILASSSTDHHIQFYSLDTLQADGMPLAGQQADIDALAFDPTGHYFASGSDGSKASQDQTILWDMASRLALSPAIPVAANSLDFNPQGTLLAIEAELWELSLESWQRFACQIANRDLTRKEWAEYLAERPYSPACSRILQQEK